MDRVLTQAQTSPWKSLVIERHISDAVPSTFSSDLINLRIQEWSLDLLPEHQWLPLSCVGPSVKERPAPLIDHPFLCSHDCPHLNLWIWGPFFSHAMSSRINSLWTLLWLLYHGSFQKTNTCHQMQCFWNHTDFCQSGCMTDWAQELEWDWPQSLRAEATVYWTTQDSFCRRWMYKEYTFGNNTWEGLGGGKLTNDLFQWRILLTLQSNSEPSQDGVRGLTPWE